MNNISLNIVANAQFQQVYAEVAKLKEAMMSLQKVSVGTPFTANTTASIKSAQSAFDQAVLSTRAFQIQHVAMTDSVTKFGQSLASGKLSLNQYYDIWRQSAKGVSAELDNLATSQARLNRSISIADPLRPGYAKLVTDINGVVTAQEKAIFYQRALNTALNDGAMKLINFGKNTQWMGRQLTVGLTMPLAMFGAAASSAYLKFDQQMTSMLKVYGSHAVVQSQQTLDVIEQQVTSLADKLARTLGVAMSDTVEIAKTFSSIGLEGKNLIAATDATVKLQKLGDLTAQTAATSMVSLQNVFKLQASQVADAVNFLNAAKHSTSTTMQDIVDALPRVGPIIQQMGGTYKDFVTFLVALKESGVPAAQGANAIKSMLASMINPTAAAKAALKSMNIDISAIVKNNQGNVMGMVQGLKTALDALPQSERLKAIEQTFGKFQFARVTALLNNLGAAGSQSAKVLELYGQSNAQLAAVAQQELDVASKGTPAARFQKMKATLQADLIPLGKTFLESFTKVGEVIDKIIGAFRTLGHLLGPVAGVLGKVFGGALVGAVIIGPILMLTGLFANLIGNLMKGANYMRMFKQGMDEAGPSQNKFAAGLKNMRNFYENLDLGMVAARNQMELMPEAITTNAQAFDTLRKAIFDLTIQFESLAVAQKEAMMGGGLAEDMGLANIAKSSEAGVMQFKLPGFADGVVKLPGSGREDKIPAMLAPGESVITAAATAKYAPILNAMNKGNLRGFAAGVVGVGSESSAFNFRRNVEAQRLQEIFASDTAMTDEIKAEIVKYLQGFVVEGEALRTSLLNVRNHIAQMNLAGFKDTSLYSVGLSSSGASASSMGVKQSINDALVSQGRGHEYDAMMAERNAISAAAAKDATLTEEQRTALSGPARSHVAKFSRIPGAEGSFNPYLWSGQSQATNQLAESLTNQKNLAVYNTALTKSMELEKAAATTESERVQIQSRYNALQLKVNQGMGLTDEELSTQSKVLDQIQLMAQEDALIASKTTESFLRYVNYTKIGTTARQNYLVELKAQGVSEEEIARIGVRNVEELQLGIKMMYEQAVSKGINVAELTKQIYAASSTLGLAIGEETIAGWTAGFREAAQIKSPSRITYMLGQMFGQGGINGMKSTLAEAEAAGMMIAESEIQGMRNATFLGMPGMGTPSSVVSEAESLTPMQQRINGMFPGMAGEAAITAETSAFNPTMMQRFGASKFAGMARGPMGMMGAAMLVPMAVNAVPDKIGGADMSGAKSTISSAASMGLMTAMFAGGPAGLAVAGGIVALKGFSMAMHSASEATKQGMEIINNSTHVNQTSLSAYNSAMGKAATSAFNLGEIHLAQYDKTSKLAQASSEAKDKIAALAGSITDAGDKAFVSSLKTANAAERAGLLATQYYADLQAGGKAYAEQRRLVYQQAAGISIDSKTAKPTNFNDFFTQQLKLGYATGMDKGGSWGNNFMQALFGGQSNDHGLQGGKKVKGESFFKYDLLSLPAFLQGGGLFEGLGTLFPGLKGKGPDFYQQQAAGKAIGQLSQGPATLQDLVSKNYLSDINSAFNTLNKTNSAIANAKETYTAWNAEVKKTQPEMAKTNDELYKAHVTLQNIVTVDKMMEAGFIRTQAVVDAMKTSAVEMMKLLQSAFPSYQAAVQKDVANAQAAIATNQKAVTDAQQALSDLQSNGQFTAQDNLNVKNDESKIKVIQDEVKTRDQLYNAQMRNIDAQQKQASLEADIISARGSGDLLKLAVAQQNYQIQKTKDAMAAAKDNADNASQNKIDALQKEIDKLNAKKDVKADQKAIDAATQKLTDAQAALAKAQTDLSNAMSGKGSGASAISNGLDKIATSLQADWATFSKNASKTMVDLVKTFGDKLGTEMMLSITEGKLKTNLEKAFTAAQAKTATSQMDTQFQAQIDAVAKAMKPGAARDKLITQIKKDQVAFDLSLAAAADVYGNSKKTDADKAKFDKAVEAAGSKAGTDIGKAEIATGNKDLVTLGNKDLLDFGKTLWTSIETALGTSIAATKAEQAAKMKERLNQAHLGIMGWFDSMWGALVGNKAIKNPNAVGGHAGTKEDPYSVTTAASKLGKNALNKDGTLTAGGIRQVIQQNKLQASEAGSFFMYQGKKYVIQQGSDATFRAAKGALVGPDGALKPGAVTPANPYKKVDQVDVSTLNKLTVDELKKLLESAKSVSKQANDTYANTKSYDPNFAKIKVQSDTAVTNVNKIQDALAKAIKDGKPDPKATVSTTSSGSHTNNNKGNHTNNNSGSHTTTNSGSHTTTNSGEHKITNTGKVALNGPGNWSFANSGPQTHTNTGTSNTTNTAASALRAMGLTTITTPSGAAINANGATISGAIKATVNVTVVQTTVTQTIKKARGGIIHAASGLLVGPGTGTSDSIPAMLSNGEYVVNAGSVAKYGPAFMDAINNKTFSAPRSSLTPSKELSDAIANSTNIGGNTINVYAPEGADAHTVANLVINKLDQQMARQKTLRRIK